jgi:hypothetical protein
MMQHTNIHTLLSMFALNSGLRNPVYIDPHWYSEQLEDGGFFMDARGVGFTHGLACRL